MQLITYIPAVKCNEWNMKTRKANEQNKKTNILISVGSRRSYTTWNWDQLPCEMSKQEKRNNWNLKSITLGDVEAGAAGEWKASNYFSRMASSSSIKGRVA